MSSCPNSNLVPRAQHCLRTFGDNNSGAEICHGGDEDHDHYFAKHECSSETTLMELKISSNETLENFICFNITLELLLTLSRREQTYLLLDWGYVYMYSIHWGYICLF